MPDPIMETYFSFPINSKSAEHFAGRLIHTNGVLLPHEDDILAKFRLNSATK